MKAITDNFMSRWALKNCEKAGLTIYIKNLARRSNHHNCGKKLSEINYDSPQCPSSANIYKDSLAAYALSKKEQLQNSILLFWIMPMKQCVTIWKFVNRLGL